MKKVLTLLLIFTLLIILTGCSSRPDNISEGVWEKGIQNTIYIDKLTKEGEGLPENFAQDFYGSTETEEEKELVSKVSELHISSLLLGLAKLVDKDTSEAEDNYKEIYDELEGLFGKNNLKKGNLDVDYFEAASIKNSLVKETEKENAKQDLMNTNNVSLTGREVQYDMYNNLDKNFYISGVVELCDYYNYGYTNEEKFFCGHLTPFDGGYSESWYLYFNRETFEQLYKVLLTGNTNLHVIAKINSKSYKKNQGNMAVVWAISPY